MRKWSKNNIVIISERKAPKDFKEIWRSEINVNQNGIGKTHLECLFIHESLYEQLSNELLNTIMKY